MYYKSGCFVCMVSFFRAYPPRYWRKPLSRDSLRDLYHLSLTFTPAHFTTTRKSWEANPAKVRNTSRFLIIVNEIAAVHWIGYLSPLGC